MSYIQTYKEKNKTGSKIKNIGSNWLIVNFRMGMVGIVRATPNKEGQSISKLEYGRVLTTIAKSMHKDTIQIKGIN